MSKWIKVHDIFEKIANIFATICGISCLLNMVIIFADVFMRLVFKKPIAGVTEYATIILMYGAYFGISYTLIHGKHMQMGALYEKLQGRKKAVINIIMYALIVFVFIVFVRAGWDTLIHSIQSGEIMQASVKVYRWPGRLAVFAGSILMAAQGAIYTVDAVISLITGKEVLTQNDAAVEGGE